MKEKKWSRVFSIILSLILALQLTNIQTTYAEADQKISLHANITALINTDVVTGLNNDQVGNTVEDNMGGTDSSGSMSVYALSGNSTEKKRLFMKFDLPNTLSEYDLKSVNLRLYSKASDKMASVIDVYSADDISFSDQATLLSAYPSESDIESKTNYICRYVRTISNVGNASYQEIDISDYVLKRIEDGFDSATIMIYYQSRTTNQTMYVASEKDYAPVLDVAVSESTNLQVDDVTIKDGDNLIQSDFNKISKNSKTVSVTFDSLIDSTTVSSNTIYIENQKTGDKVEADYNYSAGKVQMVLKERLKAATKYRLVVTQDVRSPGGKGLSEDKIVLLKTQEDNQKANITKVQITSDNKLNVSINYDDKNSDKAELTAFAFLYDNNASKGLVNLANVKYTTKPSTITEKTEDDGVLTSSIAHSYTLPDAWDGTVTESLTQVNGVYRISSGADLAAFSALVNSGNTTANAVLTADINLGGKDWSDYSIGLDPSDRSLTTNAYAGTFDGQGHTIYNLYAESSSLNQGGLFLRINGGTVKNFKVKDAKLVSTYNANYSTYNTRTSAICGVLSGEGLIENIYVSGTMSEKTEDSKMYGAGAIVGLMSGGTVKNCYSDVSISCTHANEEISSSAKDYGIGGIVGSTVKSTNNTIMNCGFGGTIDAPNLTRVGGIVGNLRNTTDVVDGCYNTGNITAYAQVAGIVGWAYSGKTFVKTAYNTGKIVSRRDEKNAWVAGLANNVVSTGSDAHFVYNIGSVEVKPTDTSADLFDANHFNALLFTKYAANASKVNGTSRVSRNDDYLADGTTMKYNALWVKSDGTSGFVDSGTRYSLAQISASDSAVLSTLNKNGADVQYMGDIGINNGSPIFTWQKDKIFIPAEKYEIGVNDGIEKTLELQLASEGEINFNIQPLGGAATVSLTDAYGNELDSKTISLTGDSSSVSVTLDSADETNVILKTTGRALVTMNSSMDFSVNLEDYDAESCRVFVWENFKTMKPISTSVSVSDPIILNDVPDNTDLCTLPMRQYLNDDPDNDIKYVKSGVRTYYIKPLNLSWNINKEALVVDNFTVKIGENPDMTDCWQYETTGNSIDIYNLKVGTRYYWTVSCGDFTSKVSTFTTMDAAPRIVNKLGNGRDLGGWKTEDGSSVKQGLLFRCREFDNADQERVREVRNNLNIKTEIDLRGDEETNYRTESALGSDINYYRFSLEQGGLWTTGNKEYLKSIFDILADESNYPVVFHCAGGKDRTGFLTYVINGLLGVPKEDLMRDYFLSGFYGTVMSPANPVGEYGYVFDQCSGNNLSERIYNYLKDEAGIEAAKLDWVKAYLKN